MSEKLVEVEMKIPWELYQELRLVWAEVRESKETTSEFDEWLLSLIERKTQAARARVRRHGL